MLQIIPQRWLEYEPPGLCHGPMMPVLGVVSSIGGMAMKMMGDQQQAAYQQAVARNNAIALRQKANEEAAVGQREAITEGRKAASVASRARALGAASGTAVASPTQVNIEAGIGAQGESNAMTALWEGMSKAQSADYQADIELFRGKQIAAAQPLQTMSTLISGVGSLAKGVSSTGGFDVLAAPAQAQTDDLSEVFRRRGTRSGLSLYDLLK